MIGKKSDDLTQDTALVFEQLAEVIMGRVLPAGLFDQGDGQLYALT